MSTQPNVDDLLREFAPKVIGVLTRRFGDFAAAEDAVQEALLAAATHWERDGIPEKPRGWLIQTATRKLTDQVRSDQARRRREELAVLREPPRSDEGELVDEAEQDDSLLVLFMCCHPALTAPSTIALTLRAVGGLTTAEIARAFLAPEATMAQRISRSKQRIKDSGVPFAEPQPDEWQPRLRAVLHVLYLMFNEGYTSSGGAQLTRADLSDEAIRLTRLVHRLLPDDAEVTSLLALMLLTESRRAARTGPAGALVPLPDQDRSLWNVQMIDEGIAVLDSAMGTGGVGEYRVQAAIAAVHARAQRVDGTDWPQIVALYGLLEQVTASAVVRLNRAVAVAMVDGPAAGLELLDTIAEPLAGHHRMRSVRAHLLEMAGDAQAAAEHYRAAAELATSVPERDYLTTKAAQARAASGTAA